MDTYSIISAPKTGLISRTRKVTRGLTPVEREVLRLLKRGIALYGNPTIRELAELSQRPMFASQVHLYLCRLASKGCIEIVSRPGRVLRIRVLELAKEWEE